MLGSYARCVVNGSFGVQLIGVLSYCGLESLLSVASSGLRACFEFSSPGGLGSWLSWVSRSCGALGLRIWLLVLVRLRGGAHLHQHSWPLAKDQKWSSWFRCKTGACGGFAHTTHMLDGVCARPAEWRRLPVPSPASPRGQLWCRGNRPACGVGLPGT